MKRKKKILLIVVLLIVIGGAIGGGIAYYMWNKPHRNIESEAPEFEMSAAQFAQEYEDEEAGNEKFLNNVVLVKGVVDEISKEKSGRETLVMSTDNGDILAALDKKYWEEEDYRSKLEEVAAGKEVAVKCYCSGVIKDSLLGMVISNIALKNCFIQSK